jgi:hypothetical protein
MSTKINITIESTGLDFNQALKLASFLSCLKTQSTEDGTPQLTEVENQQHVVLEEKEKQNVAKQTPKRAKKVALTDEEEEQAQRGIYKVGGEWVEKHPAEAKEIEVVEPKVLEVERKQEELEKEPSIKIEDIRKLVAEKQALHKDLLRAKLKEYGAANVTALPVQHYQAFYALLNALS